MAQIQSVDYKKMPQNAKQMRSEGQALNTELTQAYTELKEMSQNWYGKRYNDLTVACNQPVAQINEMLKLVVTEIPDALETVANNYSQVDSGASVAINTTAPKNITDVPKATEDTMRFITQNVTSTKDSVTKHFDNAKQKMAEIQNEFSRIDWDSEAATAFRNKLNSLKSSIETSLENIKSAFSQQMQAALDDMQSAETANTVN